MADLGRCELAGWYGRAGRGATRGSGSGGEETGAPLSWDGCGLEVGWAAPQLQGNWRNWTHHLKYLVRERGSKSR